MASSPGGHAFSDSSRADLPLAPATVSIVDMIALIPPILEHLTRNLTSRELVQLRLVSKGFANLASDSNLGAAQVRCESDSMDCYFPLRLRQSVVGLGLGASTGPARYSWNWSGWHLGSDDLHTLPSLDHLPAKEIEFEDTGFQPLLASSGGLLLFVQKLKGQPQHVPWNFKSRNLAWRRLLVSNPLTKQWRELPSPAPDVQDVWDYHGARAHLVVDGNASAYKVFMLFRDRLCVYTSTVNCWMCSNFEEAIPWGIRCVELVSRGRGSIGYVDVPCAVVEGKLFFAELEVGGNAMPMDRADWDADVLSEGAVRLFEVDEHGRSWKPAVRYALRNVIPSDVQDDLGFRIGSHAIGMVECMGGLYVLIPAALDISMDVPEETLRLFDIDKEVQTYNLKTYQDMGVLPLRFYVLQLHGPGLAFGQVFMHVRDNNPANYKLCIELLLGGGEDLYTINLYENPHHWLYTSKCLSWFLCKGLKNVINISFGDYFLEYDILSGRSTTMILPNSPFINQPNLSYTPSFCMKP